MQLQVNGEMVCLPEGATLEQLLTHLGIGTGRVAVEINREIIPRSRHGSHTLNDGDAVEIVHAIGGG
jgi:sulfur carrier protein